jgi:hypothetical protein
MLDPDDDMDFAEQQAIHRMQRRRKSYISEVKHGPCASVPEIKIVYTHFVLPGTQQRVLVETAFSIGEKFTVVVFPLNNFDRFTGSVWLDVDGNQGVWGRIDNVLWVEEDGQQWLHQGSLENVGDRIHITGRIPHLQSKPHSFSRGLVREEVTPVIIEHCLQLSSELRSVLWMPQSRRE